MTQAIERREAAAARCSVATADEAGMAGESLTELVLLLKSWRERANAKTDTDHHSRKRSCSVTRRKATTLLAKDV